MSSRLTPAGRLSLTSSAVAEGKKHLASMPRGEEAGHPVEGGTNIVVSSLLGGAGVQGHAHSHLPGLRGPRLGVEGALSIEGGLQSLGSGGKGSLESIADHLVGIPAVGFDGMAEDGFLAGEGSLHCWG